MKRRWVYIGGEAIEIKDDQARTTHFVQADYKPYQSMIDGSVIDGRSQHREHLLKNNCIEVGNEKMVSSQKQAPSSRLERLKAQLDGLTHRDANRMLTKLRDDIRFTRNPDKDR